MKESIVSIFWCVFIQTYCQYLYKLGCKLQQNQTGCLSYTSLVSRPETCASYQKLFTLEDSLQKIEEKRTIEKEGEEEGEERARF